MSNISTVKLRKKIKNLKNFQRMTKSISFSAALKYKKIYKEISNLMRNVFYFISLAKEIYLRNKIINKIIFEPKAVDGKKLIIIIASDRGLAGSFDNSIFKKAEEFIENNGSDNFLLATIGNKAEKYFSKKYNLLFSFSNFESIFPKSFASEFINYLNFLVKKNKISEIYFIRPNLSFSGFFVEDLKVFPFNLDTLENLILKIMPKMRAWQELKIKSEFKWNFEYILEPDPETLIRVIYENVYFLIIYSIILEAQASLELTKTITMKRAFENSVELEKETTLIYNKLRQQKITQEILEIFSSND